MSSDLADPIYQRDLGDGLLLRWSTPDDTESIAQLCSIVFRDRAEEPPNMLMRYLIHALMSGIYPHMGTGDFALVEDRHKQGNPLVACTCLWRHTWEYEGIPFEIGRPEIVASDPGYRHRRLIRAVFELIHARSEAEGHLVQAITGIPYFYRLFGYEYALDLHGRYSIYTPLIPKVQEGIPEPFTLRDATPEDIPLVQQLYDQQRVSSIVSTVIDERWWRYQLETWRTSNMPDTWHIQIIIDTHNHPHGYLITPTMRWKKSLPVIDMAFVSGTNIQAIMPPLLRALVAQGLQMPADDPDPEPLSLISFDLGRSHPVYEVLAKDLPGIPEAPYAWYVRVPHLPDFLRHIAPVLEQRLAHSVVAGYSGELTFDFYRGGLRMVFDQGKLIIAEDWQCPIWNAHPDGRFPPLIFLQALFGFRSLDALRAAFPDVRVNDNVEILVKALFPSRPSRVIRLG
jgi:hypothetical protein